MALRARIAAGLSGVATGLVLFLGVLQPAFGGVVAAATGTANGLKISPVTSNLTISPGETQTVQINVQNVTEASVELQAIVNDFTATSDESGTPALLLDPNQYAPSHSLKRYVAPISNFSLDAGEQKAVTVTITIPKNAPGGGYYGAVRFAPIATSGTSNVTLSASVGSLILVRVPGDVKEQLNLLSLDVRNGAQGSPQFIFTSGSGLIVTARFQNVGDVQEQPFGKVLLKQGNTQLASYEINNTTPRGNVLPDSIRRFAINLDHVGSFGKYTVYGNFGYGANGQLLSGQTTFYVIPVVWLVIIIVLILILVFGIVALPRLIRSYNRSVITRARRQ